MQAQFVTYKTVSRLRVTEVAVLVTLTQLTPPHQVHGVHLNADLFWSHAVVAF